MNPEEEQFYAQCAEVNCLPPDLTRCCHCGQDYDPALKMKIETVVVIHPFSSTLGEPDLSYTFCALCTLELGEFVEPKLKEEPQWLAQKAQLARILQAAKN